MITLNKKTFYISFYFCVITTCIKSETTVNSDKPKLDLTQDWPEADWKFLNLSDETALFSKNKDTFILNCSAPYPIQWKIEGIIEPPDFVTFQPYRRFTVNDENSLGNELFSLQIIIFFTSHEDTFSSAIITCEKIEDPQLASSYAVFVPSDNNILLVGNSIAQNFNSQYMIPCPTTDPTVNVSLHRVKDDNVIRAISFRYSPTKGFISSKSFGTGTFVCLAKQSIGNESRVNFTIQNCVKGEINREPLLVYEKAKPNPTCFTLEVKAFVGESLEVFCSSPNYTVMENSTSGKREASIVRSQISNPISQKYKIRISTAIPGAGVIKCEADGSGNITEMWNYQILGPAPELYLDNYESEVDCLSEYADRSVSTVRCRDPSACEYMKHCLTNGQDGTSCNYRRQKHFHSQYPGRCWVQERNMGASCATMPYYHLNGLVQCGGGGAVKFYMFFVGLDFHRYSNWREAPKNALIRLESEKFANRTEYFCQAAAFLFADSLKFSLKYVNGTEIFLDSTSSPDVSNPSLHGHPKRVDEFNVVGLLVRREPLPSEVVSLSCHAPWWNSTEWMTTQMKLN